MPSIKLSSLAIVLGSLMVLLGAAGLFKPAAFAAAARRFPRFTPVGYVLMLLGTCWFVYNLAHESIADFASFKPLLYGLFLAVGLGTCVFVRDFLPVRGLAVVLLLAAKLMTDTARWIETEWRLVITVWAYVWILAGMWFTVSPWRMRDLLNWSVATPTRTRLLSGLRCGFGVLVVVLGVTVYPKFEQHKSLFDELQERENAALSGAAERP
ncbi:MAG TPA: hypothetical protein VNO52_05155 [Methylomirabilota bacterium]|nr:hypothetical protein [Methylomirabilota bacterium]